MELSVEYFRAVINSLTEHIVVIDKQGVIEYANQAWIQFGIENGSRVTGDWPGVNYLDVCDQSPRTESSKNAADGIRQIITGKIEVFHLEYPCHSEDVKRWFLMTVTPLHPQYAGKFVISHQNITDRKNAEDAVRMMSLIDGLTNVANRRHFDEFFYQEWRRCMRLKQWLSLIIVDIDHFKLFNDQYGHIAGDDCLRAVAETLKSFTKRPGDFCSRYGGEEFAIVLGNTDTRRATNVANSMREGIIKLAIPHTASPTSSVVTASLGVAGIQPGVNADQTELLKVADACLYEAKIQGRNRICSGLPG